jgi:hypothetical protein
MSNPIKHHYISKFYLKNFTKSGASKQTLYAYDKVKKKYFKSNPKDICHIRNFNKISFPGKEYIVETEQAKMESIIAISFKKVIESNAYPDEEQLTHILSFISLISLRHPRMRGIFDKFYEQITDKISMMTMATEERYVSSCIQAGIAENDIIPYEKQKEFVLDKSRYKIEINQEVHIKSEQENMEHILDILYQRNWYLIISDEAIGEFITSDHPVSLISLVKLPPLYGVGYGMKKTEVCFPISKYLAFIGVFEDYDNTNKTIKATKELVKDINMRTYNFAMKQVFSTKKINYDNLIGD